MKKTIVISKDELKAAISLSLVFFLRMLPLFMVLPVLVFTKEYYLSATTQLLGFALGVYGLTQACFQIPFGLLSDRWGRKPIITLGLVLFALGSLLAATSESVYGLIIGRALQGAGAVAAAIMALAADLTSEQNRTKVMAIIGMTIGMAFSIAFVLGPLLFATIHINGLFYLSSGFALLAIAILWFVVPDAKQQQTHSKITVAHFKAVLIDPKLIRLNIAIFATHLILMANFVVIPLELRDLLDIAPVTHWKLYLVVIFISILIALPLIVLSERLKQEKRFFALSFGLVFLSQLGLYWLNINLVLIILLMILFFSAFNFLEAFLPSKVSKVVDQNIKGTALGVYASAQFVGIFIGGAIGGYIEDHMGVSYVHLLCALITVICMVAIFTPKET